MVNGQGIITVYITEESEKQGTAEGPWLALVIAEILYLKANFLHYFSVNSFFNGFSDFCKACDKGVTLKSAALIFGKNDFISVCDSYDYCRTQDRVLLIAAGRAFHHTFFLAVQHWFSTAAAEPALAVPLEKLMSCNSCKCQMLWMCSTQDTYILKFIVRKKCSIQMWNQVKALVINGEEVDIVHIKIIEPSL